MFSILEAIEYDFKLSLIFYKLPENINRKILLLVNLNQILEHVVKSQLMEKQDFVLRKDDNSRYDKAKNCNIVKQQKEENKLKYYLNYTSFPDLFLMKNCFQPPK